MRLTLNEAPPRLSMAMLLAVPLVYALFLMASWLIKVDEVALPAVTERPLGIITPASELIIEPPDTTAPPVIADKPPPPPRPTIDTHGSAPTYTFEQPETLFDPIGFRPPVVAVTAMAGRDIQVVRAPTPSMPAVAASRGISGSCDVLFDVDTRGRPFNLTAQCTHDIFKAEAIRAVSKAEFLPRIGKTGVAMEQHGAIYPIEFKVE